MSYRGTFLSEIFLDQYPKNNRLPKNLRLNAGEYAAWANEQEPDQGGDHAITNQKYGRSSGTNN
ncbi:hypothetical protein UFOVP27_130 [uncultured Caudovirales phage]|uniref:Uncharacterized protein n=1 Tax=uncultured Caudovirales phage TaxID=2100421 RepID=A0A6J5KLE9_9CAUD|nr:hypothetical protein UFOVP27_130 [uncultured Caudovirales phage]